MQFTVQDVKKIQTSVLLFLGSLMLMGGIVYYAQKERDYSRQAIEHQKTILQQARQRFESSGAEKNNIINYLPQYQNLVSTGAVGEERRLEWVDTLRNIHKTEKLFSIKYHIGAQELYQPKFKLNVGQLNITRSSMKLELAMLHEGDLLTLLGGLNAQWAAQFIVNKCDILRINDNIGSSLTPNMQAKCELDWISIHEPVASSSAIVAPKQAQAETP